MFNKGIRYYHTLKHLKWVQIKYQLLYRLEKMGVPFPFFAKIIAKDFTSAALHIGESIAASPSYLPKNSFTFLHLNHRFEAEIDWNYNVHGKLWTYNLNYFDYLNQPNMSKESGLILIRDFVEKQATISDGNEPFPTSLRIISWVKFILKHQIKDHKIDTSLFEQLQYLRLHPEYHLLGNHLLENGFALLFGGCYFNDEGSLLLAEKILTTELQEQILTDGAHFELSPMYHQIMLFRVLDSINLIQNNPERTKGELLQLLQEKATKMLAWMSAMTFENGDMPRVNDSAEGIAPNAKQLLAYAKQLNLETLTIPLSESGYRKIYGQQYEMLIDIGDVGPDYIPGHAHSDTLGFIMHHKKQPILVDTGISTYEKNAKRNLERSTAAHNTVMIEELEQTEVWGGFRVARRAKVINVQETEHKTQASHDGYKRLNVNHQRIFEWKEEEITITDEITEGKRGQAFFHFHPDVKISVTANEIHGHFGKINFSNAIDIKRLPYEYAVGFNQTKPATKVVISFTEILHSTIILI